MFYFMVSLVYPPGHSRLNLPDLYGRGYSDAPATIYDTKLYTTQLALLMQYLNWSKAHIAGVSMVRQTDFREIHTFVHVSWQGGAIGTAFYEQFPYLVDDKVALLAPTGTMETSELSRTTKLLSSPLGQAVSSTYPARVRPLKLKPDLG
jgi:pimeloyl-ACP methyl ester carboxylesterase